eukprot:Seg1039.5 transcript_id=Seg1039.5/GoldUCD/mRNA.D3Y31 product="hypothetical protein" protein_id=Seg1039.5/GoldUCD/D3Y31
MSLSQNFDRLSIQGNFHISSDETEGSQEEKDINKEETVNFEQQLGAGYEDRNEEHNNQTEGQKSRSKEYQTTEYESQTEDCKNENGDHTNQTNDDNDQPEDHRSQIEDHNSKMEDYKYQTEDDKNQTKEYESGEIRAKTAAGHSFETDNQEQNAFKKYNLIISSSEESLRGFPDSENEDSIEDATSNLLSSETVMFFVMSYLTGMSMINTPVILRYTGWGGVCAIVIIALVMAYTCNILLKGFVVIKAKKPDIFISFTTPYEERSSCLITILTFGFILYLLLSAITVLVEISMIVAGLSNKHGHTPKFFNSSRTELRVTITLIGMGLLPLTLLRSPKSYWWLSIVCVVVSVLAGLLLTTLLGNVERRNPPYYDKYATTSENYVIHISAGICNLIRFFGLHAVLSTLLSDTKEPDSAARVVSTGFLIPTIFVVIVAMMSYFAFGIDIDPNLLEMFDKIPNKGRNSFISISVIAVKGLLCMQMCFVYLLIMNSLNLYFENEALATGM